MLPDSNTMGPPEVFVSDMGVFITIGTGWVYSNMRADVLFSPAGDR